MTIIFLFICLNLIAPANPVIYIARSEGINPYEKLWYAVRMVESRNIPDIINRKEGAYGCAQIRQVKLNEYNRLTGSDIKLRECLDQEVSRKIFMWHCMQHNDIETAAKRWNGSGPLTIKYWKRIKQYMI